jgi:DNA-binding IclR family transcriptional regulator
MTRIEIETIRPSTGSSIAAGESMSETSKTVTNALRALSCFSRSAPVLTASEIARQLKLPRTNVIRLMATLESAGFVARRPDAAGFQIGLRAFEIGTLFLAANPVSSLMTKALDELVERTQCTAYLAILDRDDIVMLTCREGTLPIRFVWQVGDRLPCHTTAMGKAILAYLSAEEIDARLGKGKKLRALTENSIRTRDLLDRELEEARKRGWAVAREESHAGLTAVGSAVVGEDGYPIAAIAISYLDYPPDLKRMESLAAIVQSIVRSVSDRIAEYGSYGAGISQHALRRAPARPADGEPLVPRCPAERGARRTLGR